MVVLLLVWDQRTLQILGRQLGVRSNKSENRSINEYSRDHCFLGLTTVSICLQLGRSKTIAGSLDASLWDGSTKIDHDCHQKFILQDKLFNISSGSVLRRCDCRNRWRFGGTNPIIRKGIIILLYSSISRIVVFQEKYMFNILSSLEYHEQFTTSSEICVVQGNSIHTSNKLLSSMISST